MASMDKECEQLEAEKSQDHPKWILSRPDIHLLDGARPIASRFSAEIGHSRRLGSKETHELKLVAIVGAVLAC